MSKEQENVLRTHVNHLDDRKEPNVSKESAEKEHKHDFESTEMIMRECLSCGKKELESKE